MEETFAPAGQDYTLGSKRKVRFEQPDLWALANSKLDIPNEVAADILNLIYRGRRTADPAQLLLADQKHTQTLYYAAQLVMVPRLKLDADDEGVVDIREVTMSDLGAAYTFLLFGPPAPPDVLQPAPGQDAPPLTPPSE